MKFSFVSTLTIAGLGGLAALGVKEPAQHADPGALFKSACMGCHVAPDPAFETERAWIGQVRETA